MSFLAGERRRAGSPLPELGKTTDTSLGYFSYGQAEMPIDDVKLQLGMQV